MKYKINWKDIKNNHKGFEKLAVKYVQMEYDSNFTHTADTRDGNKDAVLEKEIYTIILGYRPAFDSVEEWWMEAKYSESKNIIPRYRLDATLVSAILKGNVGKIIFVTNMNIQSQTVNDIRQTIIETTDCKEVNFCTCNTLEYWLYQNTDILHEFFPDYNDEEIELNDLILIDSIKYYSAAEISYSFKESLRILELEQIYYANFTVFSKESRTTNLQPVQSLRGIKILTSKKLLLKKGVNNLQFKFTLNPNYGYKSAKKQHEHMLLPEPVFRIDTLQIISENSVSVTKPMFSNLEILSQRNIEKELCNFFAQSNRGIVPSLFFLYGQSGVGKSQVLNNYICSSKKMCFSRFYCEMSGDYPQDLKNLMDCINYIYFPFLPSDEITVEYLKHLEGENYFPSFYLEMIASRTDEQHLSQMLLKYISENILLFPKRIYINQRQIIIDNVHKITNSLLNVLYKIVIELSMIKAPFQIIFSGQWVQHTSLYSKMCSLIKVEEKELKITNADCINLFPNQTVTTKIKKYLESNQLFSNIIELLVFSIYLNENNKSIQTFEDFQILYHLFFRKNILDIYLKRLFNNALSNDSKAFEFCNQVYWNIHGLYRTDTEEERKLLCYHIIKLDQTAQKVLPYHDLYAKWYRKNYVYTELLHIPFVELLEHGKFSDVKSVADKLHIEYEKKNYIVVYYTLEPVFKSDSDFYRNLMDDITYFTLFQDYAHSCAFCSIDYSGSKLFRQVYTETKVLDNPAPEIQRIHNAALWELTNSTFEALKYKQALEYCDELLKKTKRLVTCGIINGETEEDSIYYHNANVIKSMIKSELQEDDNDSFFQNTEQQMLRYKKVNRLWSFRVRYSLTLMQQNPQMALQILEKCYNYYHMQHDETEKYYLWSCFYISYIKMIITEEPSTRYAEEVSALSSLEKMKDLFFNDYRKMLFGIILYFYYCNNKDKADLWLLKESHVLREKRPRLKGFEHLVLAFKHIMEKENLTALNELENAYIIFGHIPSYSKLILHNISLIKTDCKEITKIKYYLGGALEKDIYYLDIRGCW